MATNGDEAHHRAAIGNAKNFWLYSSRTGFDLTHPATPDSPPVSPSVTIQTTTTPITVAPAKSALVIIDMQNFFLSPAFGRTRGAGHEALDQLVDHAIPAARKAGIRVIWLNWGLTSQEIEDMPPAITRAFGFETLSDDESVLNGKVFEAKGTGNAVGKQGEHTVLEGSKKGRSYKGLGTEIGIVEDPETGKEIDAGKLLARDAWNSALCTPLDQMYEEGTKLSSRPDVWLHKNRMSGMWGVKTECEEFLEREGIKTLFFTGVNTDQCVAGTHTDSFSKGYDCILLNDGCGTTSTEYAQQGIEYNAQHTCGFSTTCKVFAEGVDAMGK